MLFVNCLHEAEALCNNAWSFPSSHYVINNPGSHLQHDHTFPINSTQSLICSLYKG